MSGYATGGKAFSADMTFVPFNESHSIESVAFAVSMSRQIDAKDVDFLMNAHQQIVSDLPALSFPDPVAPAVEFAFRRPDGTATWALRCSGNEIVVECTRYTRWAKIWDAAYYLLSFASRIINGASTTGFSKPMMRIVDRFKFVGETYDASDIIKHNRYIPDVAFHKGRMWHANVGWFDEMRSENRILHNLNVQSRSDVILDRHENKIMPNIYIVIGHQQIFFSNQLMFEEAFSGGMLGDIFPRMHENNKEILFSLLTDDAVDSIQLVGK